MRRSETYMAGTILQNSEVDRHCPVLDLLYPDLAVESRGREAIV
jgi:hypothetical protein